jgi:dTDP-4-dehydrorhamnose 3,5-epimerase
LEQCVNVSATALAGVMIVDTTVVRDGRGTFTRLFCANELSAVIGGRRIVQINHSLTATPGSVRGLHFQHAPEAEMKLVRCLKGRVLDVAVDLRERSSTLLRWHAEELSPENARMLVVPEGCAHGFQALERDSELLYAHTAPYVREAEDGVRFDDPLLAIRWPLAIAEVSARDRSFALLRGDFAGIRI